MKPATHTNYFDPRNILIMKTAKQIHPETKELVDKYQRIGVCLRAGDRVALTLLGSWWCQQSDN